MITTSDNNIYAERPNSEFTEQLELQGSEQARLTGSEVSLKISDRKLLSV